MGQRASTPSPADMAHFTWFATALHAVARFCHARGSDYFLGQDNYHSTCRPPVEQRANRHSGTTAFLEFPIRRFLIQGSRHEPSDLPDSGGHTYLV
jgi:hypothetical protein